MESLGINLATLHMMRHDVYQLWLAAIPIELWVLLGCLINTHFFPIFTPNYFVYQ